MNKYDWLEERNSIEEHINNIQDMCLIRNMNLKEIKQEVLEETDRILINLDHIDWAIDDIENDYEDKIDELEQEIQELEEKIEELKGGK
jgi:chromosome segregation ATPase